MPVDNYHATHYFNHYCCNFYPTTVNVRNPNVRISALFKIVWFPNSFRFRRCLKSKQNRSVCQTQNQFQTCSKPVLFSYQMFGMNQTILNQTKFCSIVQTERSVFGRSLYIVIKSMKIENKSDFVFIYLECK